MMRKNWNSFFRLLSKVFFVFFPLMVHAYEPKRTFSAENIPEELKGIKIEEKIGDFLDLHLRFTDEKGKEVQLSQFFQPDRPVLMSIVYYDCPNLCGLHLSGLGEAVGQLPQEFKEKFKVVVLSMDANETPALAKKKKENYMKKYSFPEKNWSFLTGKEKNILSVSNQLGFRFRWDDKQKIFAHLPVAYILTPSGKISRYLYGVEFEAKTLRLSLVEASKGQIGSVMDRIILFCFQFDPRQARYSWYAYNIMRGAGIFTIFSLFVFLLPVWLRENKKSKKGV